MSFLLVLYTILDKMVIFGLCFALLFINLSCRNSFWDLSDILTMNLKESLVMSSDHWWFNCDKWWKTIKLKSPSCILLKKEHSSSTKTTFSGWMLVELKHLNRYDKRDINNFNTVRFPAICNNWQVFKHQFEPAPPFF